MHARRTGVSIFSISCQNCYEILLQSVFRLFLLSAWRETFAFTHNDELCLRQNRRPPYSVGRRASITPNLNQLPIVS